MEVKKNRGSNTSEKPSPYAVIILDIIIHNYHHYRLSLSHSCYDMIHRSVYDRGAAIHPVELGQRNGEVGSRYDTSSVQGSS